MQSKNWEDAIKIISFVKPECIDKEQLLLFLSTDRTYSLETLDSLYMRKIITLQEYIEYMDKLIDREKDNIKWFSEYRKEAEEKEENYQPWIHYGFGSPSYGNVIDMERNKKWSYSKNE